MPTHLPAFLAGLILVGYWARVLRMALKARRRTGNAANFIPAEKTGRLIRIVWIPLVVAWIALPLAAGLASNLPWPLIPLFAIPMVAWSGLVILVAAFALTWVCWKKMGRSWRMGINPAEKTDLVVSGPFAFVRHPIYALSQMMMLATAAIVPSPAMLIVATGHLLLMQWEARREERHLIAVHGETYLRYRRGTGRFLPVSLRPYSP